MIQRLIEVSQRHCFDLEQSHSYCESLFNCEEISIPKSSDSHWNELESLIIEARTASSIGYSL